MRFGCFEALKTGLFQEQPLQLHHLAQLLWASAGADWDGSPLHALCSGAASRVLMGGGRSVAPLRGAAWGAKARFLSQFAVFSVLDQQGLTPVAHLLRPLTPPSCPGSVNFEIIHSLLGPLSLPDEDFEEVSQAEPVGPAATEARMNLWQAKALQFRGRAPLLRLQVRRQLLEVKDVKGAKGAKHFEELLKQRSLQWESQREDFERRLAALELEFSRTLSERQTVTVSSPPTEERPSFVDGELPGGRREAKEFIKRLRKERLLDDGRAARAKASLAAAVERLALDLYEMEGHFVFELVQNADDNRYQNDLPAMSLSLHGDPEGHHFFMSCNNEMGLRESDVSAMCDINASSKKGCCIGKKGIGWKSTFAVSDCPHVLSGSFTFCFDVKGPLKKMAYVTPTWLGTKDLQKLPVEVQEAHRKGGTVIYLPLSSGCTGVSEAFDLLREHQVTLLFLRRLKRISMRYVDGRTVTMEEASCEDGSHAVRVTDSENGSEGFFRYAIHQHELPDQKDVMRLAFPLDIKDMASMPSMAMHVGLPVRAVGFCFAVDAPFELVASRSDLHEGSPLNRLLCDAIPVAFRNFLTGDGDLLDREAAQAARYLGVDVLPGPWQQLRKELVKCLNDICCIRTEQGELCLPKQCLERPKCVVAFKASQLIPNDLLMRSCQRSFVQTARETSTAETSSVEVLSLKHWAQVLKFRDEKWSKSLVAEAATWDNPLDFFLPFCSYLEKELKADPSEFLQQLWDVELFSSFRSSPLKLCDGPFWSRACVKLRADWQGIFCEAGLLRILEPRLRFALQATTPLLLECLSTTPTRATLVESCVSWHLTEFSALSAPVRMKAVLASLACLKDSFLAEGAEGQWSEPGRQPGRQRRLWLPARQHLQRPWQLRSCSFLGIAAAVPLAAEITEEWGALLGWEAFFDAIGVVRVHPSDSFLELKELGERLCNGAWWGEVEKMGTQVMAYVLQRCKEASNFLSALPVKKICVREHFLYSSYSMVGGSYLPYVRLQGDAKMESGAVSCLRELGVQVDLNLKGLLKALKCLKNCSSIEVYADLYKEIAAAHAHSVNEEDRKLLSQLVYVNSLRSVEECTWHEDPSEPGIQWLTEVPSLKQHYHRYGPLVERYFLDVLQMPEPHPGFCPGSLLTALRNLVKHVEAKTVRELSDLLFQTYTHLAQACRRGSMTWHADVRRAFLQERLLLLPLTKPKRLFSKEAWWDVEPELADSKASNFSFKKFYEKVGDSEFLFLRVIGLRRSCSRIDISHRLKASMSSPGRLSNWTEGIDITDLEDLEDVQTSSYFRPPDWRPSEEGQGPDADAAAEAREAQVRAAQAREAEARAAEARAAQARAAQARAAQARAAQARAEEGPATDARSTEARAAAPRAPGPRERFAWRREAAGPAASVRSKRISPRDAESSESLLAQLTVLQQTAQQKRGEAMNLRQECRHVEDTAERYLRILQDFYDNM